MSLTTTELITTVPAATTILTTDSVKRKFEGQNELIAKKCRIDVEPTAAVFIDDDAGESIDDAIVVDADLSDDSQVITATNVSRNASATSIASATNESTSQKHSEEIVCPKYGELVNRREFRRAGPYIIGLKLGHSPVDSIVQYLAKKENTNEFVQLKVRFSFYS